MKISANVAIVVAALAAWGCHSSGSCGDDDCTDGTSRCEGEMVQHCVDGAFVDYDDCAAQGLVCTVIAGEAQCWSSSDTDVDSDSDSDSDTEIDTGTDTDALFYDGFSGYTLFDEEPFPFGDPDSCAFENGAWFENTGTEHDVTLACYDEAQLTADVSLPSGSYEITVAWRTGMDQASTTNCGNTHFDNQYGAGCALPVRLIVVDDVVVHESAGSKAMYDEVTVVDHDGAIGTLKLAFGTAGGDDLYDTWYDYVLIKNQ